jgi:hypothetical protein
MALAQDLMGLGESSLAAARMATGGTGPAIITAAGSSAATATSIFGTQFVSYVNATATGQGVVLPVMGGLSGCLIYDNFVVHNGFTANITVYPPTGVTINIGGSSVTQASPFALATLKTLTLWTGPTSTQWFGLSN